MSEPDFSAPATSMGSEHFNAFRCSHDVALATFDCVVFHCGFRAALEKIELAVGVPPFFVLVVAGAERHGYSVLWPL